MSSDRVLSRHDRRPDMVVCSGCDHFREKNPSLPARRLHLVGRPPSDWRRECTWFRTAEGRAASQGSRMTVMLAGANGGVGCPVARDAVP